MKIMTAVLAFCALFTATLNAQRQSHKPAIQVDGLALQIGMTKAQVAEKFVGQPITKLSDDDWLIGTLDDLKSGRDLPEVQFTSGLLTYADRSWTTANNDTADALFGAVKAINEEGLSKCVITADSDVTSPSGVTIGSQRVWMMCSDKTILVSRRTIAGKFYSSVYERLGSRH